MTARAEFRISMREKQASRGASATSYLDLMESEIRAAKVRDALEQYRQKVSPFYDQVVEEVALRAAQEGCLGKADIGALVVWKRLNASTTWAKHLMQTADEVVRAATATARHAALESDLDLETAADRARASMSEIPGFKVGDALASAVIYALAPARMAVYDRRAQRGLERLGLELTARPGRYGRYMARVDELATDTSVSGDRLSAREIDLALYTLGGPPA